MQKFTKKDLQKIEQAVRSAEKKTSGEIVPLIVTAALPLWLKRFIPLKLSKYYTNYRARRFFFEQGIHKTVGQTGIIIVIFLQERCVEVIADKGISAHYPATTWEELVKIIVRSAQKDRLVQGLCQAIGRCGKILQAYCPRQKNDRNELTNKLRILR